MKKFFLYSLGIVMCAFGIVAMGASAATVVAPQDVQSGKYHIDPYHTQVVFSLSHFGFTQYTGMLSDISGSLQLDSRQPQKSKLTVHIPIKSIQTTSPKLVQELQDKDWLDAAHYPEATFVSQSIVSTGTKTADVKGHLTLHGITKPVLLHVTYMGAGVNPLNKAYTVGFQIKGTIHRSDFGIEKYLPAVGDNVSLDIAGAFEK